jgi:HK97 family phage major capsid protein/HK97 family phage prohead protease
MTEQIIKTGNLFRSLTFDRAAGIDVAARTVELAFATETPYTRWFGVEVLDCQPGSVRLDRLNNGGALLDNHDSDEQIGVVEKAWVDPDKVCRAQVRFSKNPEAEQIFQDVLDGIIRHVSVGYMIHKYVEETTVAADGTESSICRVVDFEPYEVSLVAVPADPECGVNRSPAGAVEHDTLVVRSTSAPKPADEITPAPEPVIQIIPQKRSHSMDTNTDHESGRQAEQKRTADLLALADTYAEHGARELVADFIRNGKSTEQFLNAVMAKITEKHTSARSLEVGLTAREQGQYSILRAINAVLTGDWSKAGLERAASEAVAKRTGFTPEGFFVPVEAYSRTFLAGTAGEAGNLIQTSVLGNEFIDVLRNALVLNTLGIRVLGGLTSNIAIPRKSAATTIASYSEIATITASNPTTTQITLSPKRVGGQVPYSKQALIQANPDVEMMLRDDLAKGVAVQIENLAINGLGSSNQPRGLFATSGIGSVVGGTNGLTLSWSHLVDLESAAANANSEPDLKAGYLINTKTRGIAKKVQKATNLQFLWDNGAQPLNSYKAAVSNNVPSNGTKGSSSGICSSLAFGSDWGDLVLGLFGGLDIVVDPYTQAGTGQVIITANQFIDVACRQPASFSAMTDALT